MTGCDRFLVLKRIAVFTAIQRQMFSYEFLTNELNMDVMPIKHIMCMRRCLIFAQSLRTFHLQQFNFQQQCKNTLTELRLCITVYTLC